MIQKDAKLQTCGIWEYIYDSRLIDVNIQTSQVQVMSGSLSEVQHTRITVSWH